MEVLFIQGGQKFPFALFDRVAPNGCVGDDPPDLIFRINDGVVRDRIPRDRSPDGLFPTLERRRRLLPACGKFRD